MVGYGIAFVLAEALPQTPGDRGGTVQGEGDAVAEYVPTGHGAGDIRLPVPDAIGWDGRSPTMLKENKIIVVAVVAATAGWA